MVLITLLVFAVAGVAFAASASITPHTQSHAHGVASNWTLSWGNAGPYDVNFYRGNGTVVIWTNTNQSLSSQSYKFYPCTTTTFQQWLRVSNRAVAMQTISATRPRAGATRAMHPCRSGGFPGVARG